MRNAIGLVETIGLIGAVEALDVALKSANVNFLNIEFVKGGIVTITISGDVGAVKAAVESSETATKKLGCYRTSHVIPRPCDDVFDLLNKKPKETSEIVDNVAMAETETTVTYETVETETETALTYETVETEVVQNESLIVKSEKNINETQEAVKENVENNINFNEMRVGELKEYVYKHIGGYSRNELKKMNKVMLLAIVEKAKANN